MKRTKGLLTVVILVATVLIMAGCSKKPEAPVRAEKQATAVASNDDYMRISFIKGDVEMKTAESEDYGYASMNTPIREGDEFWVPRDGRLEIQLKSGTYIRLDQESSIQMIEKDKDSLLVYLSEGHAYVVHDAPEGGMTRVDTADVSTRVDLNSIFRVDLMDDKKTDDKYTEVGVYKEYVETENDGGGSTKVPEGNVVALRLGTDGEVAPMGPPDEWEKWNQLRNDKLFKRGDTEEKGNLPKELKSYSSDFDDNGKWIQVPKYGTVWTPTVGVGADWAPYKEGRWVWRDNDYVWVGTEPWGWVPYHYGRWAFVEGAGWCWVPPAAGDVYWGPGYVGWAKTNDYVAWVPLAPSETYYGRGNYGSNSVNIDNTNVNEVSVSNGYINNQVNNGATVVTSATFATGSPEIVKVDQGTILQKIFVKININLGTPAIKPTRASYFASARLVPAEKLPPRFVRDIKIKEIKRSHRLIKDRNQSVFTPGKPVAQLPVHKVDVPRTRGKSKPPALVRYREVRGLDGERGQEKDHKPQEKMGRDQNRITNQQQHKGEVRDLDNERGQKKDHKPQEKMGRDQNRITNQQQHKGEVRDLDGERGQKKDHKPKVKMVQSLGRDPKQTGNQQQHKDEDRGRGGEKRQEKDHKPKVKMVQSLGRDPKQTGNQQQHKDEDRGRGGEKRQEKEYKQKVKADRDQNQTTNQQQRKDGDRRQAGEQRQGKEHKQQVKAGRDQNQINSRQSGMSDGKSRGEKQKKDDGQKKHKRKNGEKDDTK